MSNNFLAVEWFSFPFLKPSRFLFTLTDCFCLLWQMKIIGVPDFPIGLFLGEPMNRPACLQALLPCMCPGNGLDHLRLCLSHIPCGFMCCHINMEQQRFIDKFLAACRSRSNNQKTDLQPKTVLSSSWPKIWRLLSYYICIYAHEYVHVSNMREVTYIHMMPVHSLWFSGRMCILQV